MEKKTNRKEIIKWVLGIAVVAFLVVTDLHKPIIANLQKAILATGIMQPNITADDKVQKAVDLDVALINEHGVLMNMKDFEGKVLFINLWATWCPPCRAEMPGIQNLFEKVDTGTENIEFVMISSDRDFQTAIEYKQKYGFTFPIYQLKGPLPRELESQILPTTFVIDSEGHLVLSETGMAKYDSDKFVAFIKGLLK